jgi:hypothetical protein
MPVRKAPNCSLVWRGAALPSTSPVAVFSAANKPSVRVALVIEAVAFGPSGRQRQQLVLAIERLDGGLLVDAEQSCGVSRRVEVQAGHIGSLRLEVRIVRNPVGPSFGLRLSVSFSARASSLAGGFFSSRPGCRA